MKTIAITNHKGGVGKSGLTVCLAGALREAGRQVLVVDLDQQATSTEWLGLRHPGELVDEEPYGGPLREVISSASSISHLICASLSGVDVVPSGSGFASFDQAVAGTIAAERLLTKSLAELPPVWDYVLLDCPPSLGLVTVNALVAADSLLVPVEPKSASRTPILTILQLAREVQAQLDSRLELLGIVASRFQPRLQHRQVDTWLRTSFGEQVFDSVIRESTHVSESHAYQMPVTRYMPKCNGSADFKALCSEFLSRVERSTEGLREVRFDG